MLVIFASTIKALMVSVDYLWVVGIGQLADQVFESHTEIIWNRPPWPDVSRQYNLIPYSNYIKFIWYPVKYSTSYGGLTE
ncbi:MAG: hypothetical protein CM1200mP35_10200 [Chloroflexota bacterium]|nr:MAG: hypothetical protein CM1200mP35_10200 [Chloroflexota bacterium]